MEHEMLKIEREIGEIKETTGRHAAQIKTLFERVGNLDKLVETVHSIAKSTELLAQNQGTIQKDVQGLRRDMDDIKARPIKRWRLVAEKIGLTAIGIVVGWALKQIGIF